MFRVRNKKKKEPQNTSMIGKIIDLPLEDFKKELYRQKVNLGTNNNLILTLSSVYHDLSARKDAIVQLVTSGEKTKEEVQPILDGLYNEMMKVEEKITYLRERSKRLLDDGATTS